MATYLELRDLPIDLSEAYLPYTPTLRQRQKAYAFSRNSYVHNVNLFGEKENHGIQISAKVYRSQQKSEEQHVNMTLNAATKIMTDGYCSCKAGTSCECAHLLATIMTLATWLLEGYRELPAEQSCTSIPQIWDKLRGPKVKPEPVSQMVLCKQTTISRKRRPLIASFRDKRKLHITDETLQSLQKLEGCPISYMAKNVDKVETSTNYGPQYIGSALSYHVPLMNPVKPPSEQYPCGNLKYPAMTNMEMPFLVMENRHQWENLRMTVDQCVEIEKETRNQTTNSQWFQLRKQRLTASNFGKIIKRKSTISQSFLKSIIQKQEFVSKPTTYGKGNENVARQMYIKKTKNHVHEIGLVINPSFPYLGATPDL